MRLFADPPRLDRGGEHFERGIGRQVRRVIYLLSGRSPLADKPDLVTRHALHAVVEHPVLMTFRDADPASREEAGQPPLGAAPPANLPSSVVGQHRLSGHRWLVGHVVLAAPAGLGDREDQANIGRVDVLASRKPDCPQ